MYSHDHTLNEIFVCVELRYASYLYYLKFTTNKERTWECSANSGGSYTSLDARSLYYNTSVWLSGVSVWAGGVIDRIRFQWEYYIPSVTNLGFANTWTDETTCDFRCMSFQIILLLAIHFFLWTT